MSESLVECRGLCKTFSTAAETLPILVSLDLAIPTGVTCSIMGASGSGKSTLLSILGGLETADSGLVRVGRFDLSSPQAAFLDEYRTRGVGFVFQFHNLLKDFTALENVALPAYLAGVPRREAWENAMELLHRVGMAERAGHYPAELSGGERQRAAIARALINSPSLVLADEPTGNLDAASVASVRELLFSLPALLGTTLVLATHDRELAAAADLRFRLFSGKLEAAE